jgi:alcohol dehydrogenase/propanol-preferring alcohol dehydrogenase
METTDGGAAAAIDFVGSPKTMEFGVNALRKGGKLVMVRLYAGACPISTVLFPFKMMTIEGCAYRLYHLNVVPMETAEPSD